MVINRTFDGYITEIKTIYGQLQVDLQRVYPNIKIEPAPDEWDRLYNVDFFILINENYIGIQIKPAGDISGQQTNIDWTAAFERSSLLEGNEV